MPVNLFLWLKIYVLKYSISTPNCWQSYCNFSWYYSFFIKEMAFWTMLQQAFFVISLWARTLFIYFVFSVFLILWVFVTFLWVVSVTIWANFYWIWVGKRNDGFLSNVNKLSSSSISNGEISTNSWVTLGS